MSQKTGSFTVCGKVLFYGGFSVLEPGGKALSLGVLGKNGEGLSVSWKTGERRIISPQFSLDFEPSPSSKELVNAAYLSAEEFLSSKKLLKEKTSITLENSEIFGKPGEKSGLGSSAAATAGVVKAVFEANGFHAKKEEIRTVSKAAYDNFSGKIGSGFDIATSSWDSPIIYSQEASNPKITPFNFPHSLCLLFFNVRGGKTSTISSVKSAFLAREKSPEEYSEIISLQRKAEEKAISALSREDLPSVRKQTHEAREAHRKLQVLAGKYSKSFTPIEPPELSRIIESAETLPGIVAGRCPGAGGYDGLAFIARKGFSGSSRIIEAGKKEGLKLQEIKLKVL